MLAADIIRAVEQAGGHLEPDVLAIQTWVCPRQLSSQFGYSSDRADQESWYGNR